MIGINKDFNIKNQQQVFYESKIVALNQNEEKKGRGKGLKGQ